MWDQSDLALCTFTGEPDVSPVEYSALCLLGHLERFQERQKLWVQNNAWPEMAGVGVVEGITRNRSVRLLIWRCSRLFVNKVSCFLFPWLPTRVSEINTVIGPRGSNSSRPFGLEAVAICYRSLTRHFHSRYLSSSRVCWLRRPRVSLPVVNK